MVKGHLGSEKEKPLLPVSARTLLYQPSHKQDSTYHSLCYTSCGTLVGTAK